MMSRGTLSDLLAGLGALLTAYGLLIWIGMPAALFFASASLGILGSAMIHGYVREVPPRIAKIGAVFVVLSIVLAVIGLWLESNPGVVISYIGIWGVAFGVFLAATDGER